MRKIQTVNGKLQEKDWLRLARQKSNETNGIPIKLVDGRDITSTGRYGYHYGSRWNRKYKSSTRQIELGKNWARNIKEPSGCAFYWTSIGFCVVRKSDGLDYHPTKKEVGAKNFATLIRKGLADNYNKRLNQRRAEEKLGKYNKIYLREAPKCRVTLFDSRKAGNCIEGSLVFAQRFLRLSREEILNGGYLFSTSGDKLLKTGDVRAEKAVRVAFQRETTVSI